MPECCFAFEGEWDSSNAQALMQYTHDKGYQVWGFEYGNEMAGFGGVQIRLDPDMYVRGMCEMKRLIDNIWSDVELDQRPRIIAPDSAMDPEWFTSMLKISQDSGCLPHVVTWHQYLLGAGVDPDVGDRCMNPTVLDRQLEEAGISQSVVHDKENARFMDWMPELWMGETGGAYNSGRHMVTDAFHGSFWYLDRLVYSSFVCVKQVIFSQTDNNISNLLHVYTDTGITSIPIPSIIVWPFWPSRGIKRFVGKHSLEVITDFSIQPHLFPIRIIMH
jgi:heparanase 1